MEEEKKRVIPYGFEISILAGGMDILATGNMYKIRVKRNGARFVQRTKDAEAWVKRLRSVTRQAVESTLANNETLAGCLFPLEGKLCQIRVDAFIAYGPDQKKALKTQDVDNILKGIYDALKVGPTHPAGNWGIIDDDRYIVGGYVEKGEAPDDGGGSRILLRISRARIRNSAEMSGLVSMGVPIFPPFRLEDQSRIIKPQILVPGGN